MIRSWMMRFMAGRYGGDQLNMLLIALYVILYVYRSFSRDLERRRGENARFLQAVRPAARRWNAFRARAHDKEHRYFKCPNCGQQMRVPRGKGRITVHCRSCGAVFEEKS